MNITLMFDIFLIIYNISIILLKIILKNCVMNLRFIYYQKNNLIKIKKNTITNGLYPWIVLKVEQSWAQTHSEKSYQKNKNQILYTPLLLLIIKLEIQFINKFIIFTNLINKKPKKFLNCLKILGSEFHTWSFKVKLY